MATAKDMNRADVAAETAKTATVETAAVVEMPAYDCPAKRYTFYFSDAAADPPNALRAVDMCPIGGCVDVLAADVLPDDTIAAILDGMSRLTKLSRDRMGGK